MILSRGRTNNRIRSSRCVASSRFDNVSEGSRQNRSVTLGKRLALKIRLVQGVVLVYVLCLWCAVLLACRLPLPVADELAMLGVLRWRGVWAATSNLSTT